MLNILKKILRLCVRLLLGLILLVLGILLFRFGKQKIEEVQAHRALPEVRAEMQSLSANHIPANVSVLAIGEAVHGSREFQALKLSVLREMVEKQGYTAFALEADYSECADINRYLQSGEGKPEELVQKFSFPIYHTKRWRHCSAGYRIGTGQRRKRKKSAFTALICRIPRPVMPF